jgi:hypothetical protein
VNDTKRFPIGDDGTSPEPVCLCPDCAAGRSRRKYKYSSVKWTQAVERAETLLRRFLTPEQLVDWDERGSVVVIGSAGNQWRLTPRYAPQHASVVRSDNVGVSVWHRGLEIQADWLLALLLELQADEHTVFDRGCKATVRFLWPAVYADV